MKQRMQKALEDRAELEKSDTIIGRLLVLLTEEGVLSPDSCIECASPAPCLLHCCKHCGRNFSQRERQCGWLGTHLHLHT